MPRRRLFLATVLATALAGCGGDKASVTTAPRTATTTTHAIAISPGERPACALLFAHLQRVTLAIRSSSELIARSLNQKQLAHRIAIEQVQLRRSARLIEGGPIPAALRSAARELAVALRAFAHDFAGAQASAVKGDFQAASAAMTDAVVVKRIIRASKTIEDACR
jgi:hypothetical protein